ncbi:MAG: hypothetical protein AAFV27_00535 [Pseudomonadota bacterium]
MRDMTKIATCSYCGNRTILNLAGRVQHELACSSCGARLHTMKHLKTPKAEAPKKKPKRNPMPVQPQRSYEKQRKRKAKKRRFDFGDLIEDIWDEIEDIFD